MQKRGDRLVFSPSDLNGFLECDHLTALDLRRCREDLTVAEVEDAEAALRQRLGLEHEAAWRARFADEGRTVIAIAQPGPEAQTWVARALDTVAAMRTGADVIYQAVFVDDDWRGIADFLVKVPEPSGFGGWSHEAWDTKLGRHAKPTYALQLAFYTDQIQRLQGSVPKAMHVVLGHNRVERLKTDDYLAYYRSVKRRFSAFAASPGPTSPYPIEHCGVCRYRAECDEAWRTADHLSLVAGIRRETALRLERAGVTTMTALANCAARPDTRIGEPTFVALREQARLQRSFIDSGRHSYELIDPAEERGFAMLPEPSDGDLFFDMEGYPYFEPTGGLEYLFGVAWLETGTSQFTSWWGTDRAQEKAAFEAFIDFVRGRLRQHPNLHVYHYASYERSKLGQLAQQHATREEELDDLLRRQVFVDLYKVTRQALRTSHEGYSLKDVRQFFMEDSHGEVATAGQSIVQFDRWLRTGEAAILEAIERYNEEDCISTLRLRDWLIGRKLEAEVRFGFSIPWRPAPDAVAKPVEDPDDWNLELRASLMRQQGEEQETVALRLLAGLLDYHRREDKPEWWDYFDRLESSTEELERDAEAIVGLEPAGAPSPPASGARSWTYPLSFPLQEYKFDVGANVEDLRTGKKAGEIVTFDHAARVIGVRRGGKPESQILPRVLVAGKPLPSNEQRGAVRRVAEYFNNVGLLHAERYRAVADLLLRRPPRFRSRLSGEQVQTLNLTEQQALVADLDQSTLVIQGPPGSGKTWTAARLIVSLLQAGARVGVSAFSHRAIHNLLEHIEDVATGRTFTFDALKKASAGRPDSRYVGRFIKNTEANGACSSQSIRLIAGTSYLFSREDIEQSAVDYLFIDEAGQLSLGDAVAMGVAARNLVLLGDPQQLPQVAHGVHPHGADQSVLQHYLGADATIPPERGLFLARTYRMHPDLCEFVSRLSYDGRLEADASCAVQRLASAGQSGTGIRFLPVEHRGNAQLSVEEADLVAREVEVLLRTGEFTDRSGHTRRLDPADILVVAPYNMQVRCLRDRLPGGVEVGTVDKFQGREAPVVFFSLATSSADDLPRNMEFLFSRNRLNVAISRARCLSILVASPRLLDVPCHTLEQMALVNGLCHFVESASSM